MDCDLTQLADLGTLPHYLPEGRDFEIRIGGTVIDQSQQMQTVTVGDRTYNVMFRTMNFDDAAQPPVCMRSDYSLLRISEARD